MSELPERIGHYRIESALGRGGMGEVFLAWDERLRRRVALKRLRADVADSPASRERFRREASTAAELSHPSAVHVYDLVEETDGDYLVMEYVPGDSLRHRLARGPLSVIETLRFGRQIAEGLAAAHGAGLIHRDLKADNVILTEKGEAKILDFGLARHICPLPDETSLTQRGFVVGTYHAMSPEQATGGPVDERSDLFSLGSLLAEMLTGKPFFKADTPAATLRRVLAETPPPLATLRSDVPEALSSLISRLLAKDPADRPASAEQVARALREIAMDFQGDSAALAPTISELPTSWEHPGMAKPRSRKRWWVYGAVGVVGLAGIGAAYWLWPRPSLRVLVAPPTIDKEDDPTLRLAGQSAMLATLSVLTSLRGVAVLDPSALPETTNHDVTALAEAVDADEVLVIDIKASAGGMCRLAIGRRLRDGRVMRPVLGPTGHSIQAGDLQSFANSVSAKVEALYSDREALKGATVSLPNQEDLALYFRLKERLDMGESDLQSMLTELEPLLKSSPNFHQASLFAADIHLSQFPSTKDEADLERASALIEKAQKIKHDDRSVLRLKVKLGLKRGDPEAGSLLETLLRRDPGFLELLPLQAEKAELDGNTDEAVTLQRTAVEQLPSWRNYYLLADLEFRTGRASEAREHLEVASQRWPSNTWVEKAIASGELLYGDAKLAEEKYRELLTEDDAGAYANLGVSLFLQRRFDQAIEAYRKALEIQPVNSDILLNLADAEHALGRAAEARTHYHQVRALLESNKALVAEQRLALAQCLAHLGESRKAVGVADAARMKKPDDPFVAYTAALVHALAGETDSAVLISREALEAGLAEHWFEIPALEPVWNDREFQDDLEERRK